MFHLKKEYMLALEKQLKHDVTNYLKDETIETVFIGGGTPSCVSYEEYEKIFDIINPKLAKNAEVTTEANPNSATYEWLENMKKLGVNRVSFGVQSFDDKKLKFLGRAHNANSAITAIQNAKCIGFNGINCDIIYGCHGDSLEKLKRDFDQINALDIDHISAYSLTLEEGTKFYKKSSVKIDDEDLSYEIFDYLKQLGYNQYEISNFSKSKEKQSAHNYGYWQQKKYLGVGSGAVGFVENYRYYPSKDIHAYIENSLECEKEFLSDDDIKIETILLGLRCSNGIEKSIFSKEELSKVEELIENNKLTQDSLKIYNPNFLLADELALYITE